MAKNKNVDLSGLKKEISERKQSVGIGTTVAPKDEFVNGLLTSLQSGRETQATKLIKIVENKTNSSNNSSHNKAIFS